MTAERTPDARVEAATAEAERRYGTWPLETDDPSWSAFVAGAEWAEAVQREGLTERVERLCEVMHDAYESAAVERGWETQKRSRKPWADVPEANKATMRIAVAAVLAAIYGARP